MSHAKVEIRRMNAAKVRKGVRGAPDGVNHRAAGDLQCGHQRVSIAVRGGANTAHPVGDGRECGLYVR